MQPAALTTSFIFEPTMRISFEPPLAAFLAVLFPLAIVIPSGESA